MAKQHFRRVHIAGEIAQSQSAHWWRGCYIKYKLRQIQKTVIILFNKHGCEMVFIIVPYMYEFPPNFLIRTHKAYNLLRTYKTCCCRYYQRYPVIISNHLLISSSWNRNTAIPSDLQISLIPRLHIYIIPYFTGLLFSVQFARSNVSLARCKKTLYI